MLAFPLMLGLMQPYKPRGSYVGFWLFFLVLLVFSGFRHQVGPDWAQYVYIFSLYKDMDLGAVSTVTEPGYFLLNKISHWLGWGHPGLIFLASFIFLFGCFNYARQTSNPWLAVAVVIPYLIFIISFSGVRQACAIGFGFYLFAHWGRHSLPFKLLLIGLAISFHNSAAVMLLFIIIQSSQKLWLKAVLAGIVMAFIGFSLSDSYIFEKYSTLYIENNLISGGAFFHVLLIAFPSTLYLLYYKKLQSAGLANFNVVLGSIFTLLAVLLLTISSTGIDRLTLYFSFVQMWVYPALFRINIIDPQLLRACIALLVLSIFWVYFMFGSHAFAYLPYQNIIFKDIL
jgi:EpsG family